MKCPLRETTVFDDKGEVNFGPADCLKEECAWWLPAFKVCSILEIAIRLGSLADNVFSIMDKMPHEEQFRK